MRQFLRFVVLIVLSLAFSSVMAVWGQSTNPSPAPAEPTTTPANPPAALAAAPPAPAASNNPSVMLLKTGSKESVRAEAAKSLGKDADPTTIPALAAALSDPSAKVRREVVLALAQFHRQDALPPLEQATKDLDDGVRVAAVQCLVGYYTGVLPGSGFTGFMRKSWERAAGHFQPDDTRIDPGITVDPTVVTALIAVMKDTRSNEGSRQAAEGLGILTAKAAVPDLVAAAHSSDPDLAREALNSLSKIKDLDSGPKLVDLLDSPNKNLRRDACVAVGILRAKEALPKLQTLFQNGPEEKDKVAAMQGLAYLGNKVSVPVFTKALWSDNKDIRVGAGEGLARAADPQSLRELQKAVSVEKDASAKLAMEYALAALGKADALNDVVSELTPRCGVTWPALI